MPSAAQYRNEETDNQRFSIPFSEQAKKQQQHIHQDLTNDQNLLKNKTKKISKQQQLEKEQQQLYRTKKLNPNSNTLKNDEKSIDLAMISPRNYVQRKKFYGPLFDVDHLATFTVGSKNGLLKAEDGMRKLRNMEKQHGIWTMQCQLLIDPNFLVVYDKNTGQEVEIFPLDLVTEPTSVVSDDKRDSFNNIVLFTVLEDNRKQKSHSSSTPTEMHIFQSSKAHSIEIVDEILKVKSSGALPSHRSEESRRYAPTTNEIQNNPVFKQRAAYSTNSKPNKTTNQIDFDVQVLNHCFDDIERFVTRLQNSLDSYRELEKRKKDRKSHKTFYGDGMLTLRSQMPSSNNFVDIFQKFKLSFNLLAKLKAHIHDPNAPELVHFLFTPLALIVNTCKEQPYQGLGKTVWTPLITKDAKDLLLNCLTSKEQDLWMSLGDGWTTTREEVMAQPVVFSNLNNDIYNPVFFDGWAPILTEINKNNDDKTDLDKLAKESVGQVQANSHKYNQPLPIQKSRYYSNTQPINFEEHQPKTPRSGPIRNYDEMKKWASDLSRQGVKISEVIHDRQANNDKELSVKSGEFVEVLDDKRNWWRLKNFYGEIGHAPVTILRPFDIANLNQQYNDKYSDGHKQQSSILPSSSSLSSSSNLDNSDFKTSNHFNNFNSQLKDKNKITMRNRDHLDRDYFKPKITTIEKYSISEESFESFSIESNNKLGEKTERYNFFQQSNHQVEPEHEHFIKQIQPLKGMLFNEIERRMDKDRRSELSYYKREKSQDRPISLNALSQPSEVKAFLQSKGFSNKVILMFGELNGVQLFSLNREDFEKFCGKEEGIRLDSHVKIQKSLSGYENKTNELIKILEKRKEKSETEINKL